MLPPGRCGCRAAGRCPAALDFYGDQHALLFDQIIGPSGQPRYGIVKGFLDLPPVLCITRDDPPGRQARGTLLPAGPPQQDQRGAQQ
jgi:hypothetical protein